MHRYSFDSTRSSAPSSQRRGAALVEMAVVLPVFFLVVLGIVEFGRAMMTTQIISNATREGARRAILNGSTNSEVANGIRDFISETCRVSQANVQVDIAIEPGPNNDDPLNQLANANEGDLVTVTVQVPFRELSYLRASFLGNTQINGQATMRHE